MVDTPRRPGSSRYLGGWRSGRSSDQNHEKQGRSTVADSLTTAQRRQRVGRQKLGQVRFGQPLGHQQPAVIGDDPDLLPAGLEQSLNAVDQVADQLGDAVGQSDPLVVPGLVDGSRTRSRPGRCGSPISCAVRHLEAASARAACGIDRASGLCRPGEAGPELLAGDAARDLAGHGRDRRLRGRGDGRQGNEMRLQARPCRPAVPARP